MLGVEVNSVIQLTAEPQAASAFLFRVEPFSLITALPVALVVIASLAEPALTPVLT